MGYTHYWSYVPDHAQWIERYPQLVIDARAIIERAGVPLAAGVEGYESERGPLHGPQLDERWIWFNGVGAMSHETFVLYGPGPMALDELKDMRRWYGKGSRAIWNFCKTARKPYDLPVCAILLRAAQLVPDAFVFASDGSWQSEWAMGAGIWDIEAPVVTQDSPRGLVRELFGDDALPPAARSYFDGKLRQEDLFASS